MPAAAGVRAAVEQAECFAAEVDDLRADWRKRHAAYRAEIGLRSRPRAGSAVARLVELLPEVPVVTTRTAQRLLATTFQTARTALEELAEAGILHRKRVDRGTTGYLAREVFDLLTVAERRLASTRWDTREARPNRPVPAPG